MLMACGSAPRTAVGCHVNRTCPSNNGSYAWRPLPGVPPLVCGADQAAYPEFLDYRGRFDLCKLPAPADPHTGLGGVDFLGPTTVAAGSAPLRPHELRFRLDVFTRRPAVLKVDYGDGTTWHHTVTGNHTFNLIHSYPPTRSFYFFVSLRDKVGYLSVSGVGPFRGPPPGPRPRYCGYEAAGKGGTLSATALLTCSAAQKLFSALSPRGKLSGYRCRNSGLPPAWSDVNVITCTSGLRSFVFTSNQ